MKLVRQVSEHDVIAEFLKAEFYHQEYDKDRELFEPLVQKPDTQNDRENVLRRALLFRRRGHMWRELPPDTQWYEVEIEAEDLGRIRVFPRAQWRKISDGSFHLVDIADRIRRRPGRGGCDAVIAKIQLLRFHLLHTPRQSSVLLIGLDSRSAFTILEGNHRMAAALLVSPELVQTGFHVLCGLSPRMHESCWYETNFSNLWRYFKHRARHLLDREADVAYAVRNFLDYGGRRTRFRQWSGGSCIFPYGSRVCSFCGHSGEHHETSSQLSLDSSPVRIHSGNCHLWNAILRTTDDNRRRF